MTVDAPPPETEPSQREITIQAYARLHLGLWAWGSDYERQFGGVGLMVSEPSLLLRITPSRHLRIVGPAGDRVRHTLEQHVRSGPLRALPSCEIAIERLPLRHAGFGVGTQLALAVARGLAAWEGVEVESPAALAMAAGRGRRSAVGTYGFAHGGLIVDGGKQRGERLGTMLARVAVPEAWRVLLITPRDTQGKSGTAETDAFANLPPVPRATAALLRRLALEVLRPACEAGDFERFAPAVYDYGYEAGKCFESAQGGAYANRRVHELVGHLRNLGCAAAGQSSWGPTVYGFVPDQTAADRLVQRLPGSFDTSGLQITVASPVNHGASLTELLPPRN